MNDNMNNDVQRILPKRFWTREELGNEEYEKLYQDYLFGRCLSGADFIQLLDENFTTFLKTLKFKGRKNHFYRIENNLLYVIGIFKDKYGGECSLNIGVHIDGYPIRGFFEKTNSSKVKADGAIIQETLSLKNNNTSLKFGKDTAEGLETIELMKGLIINQAVPFFNKFLDFPRPFNQIGIDDFLTPNNRFKEFGISDKMLNWIHFQIFIARFNYDFGDKELAIEIMSAVREKEWNSNRFTSKGISPLLPEMDRLASAWK